MERPLRTRQGRVEVLDIDPDELRLKKNVLLAYTDLVAGGSRALLGIDMRMQYYMMDIPEMRGHKPACERDRKPTLREQEFQPLQVLNCMYEEFSVVVVNTVVPGKKCHYVVNRLLELCTQSPVQKIILFTVLRLDIPQEKQQKLYENCYNTEPITKAPALPQNTLVVDPFLSTLLQMIRVEEIPLDLLIIPGHRGIEGKANLDDGSKQAIAKFQDLIREHTRLKFDLGASFNLLYKGRNEDELDAALTMYR